MVQCVLIEKQSEMEWNGTKEERKKTNKQTDRHTNRHEQIDKWRQGEGEK